MAQTIGNPLSWGVDAIWGASRHLGAIVGRLGSRATDTAMPEVRRIGMEDLRAALRAGLEDFAACRSDVVFLCILYPIMGALLTWFAFDARLLALIFPVVAGFALIGPVAGVGLYEMSRRRERGEEVSWLTAFAVMGSPSFGAILALGLALGLIFVVWIATAQGIYALTLGPYAPLTARAFLTEVLTTPAGWTMIVAGFAAGAVFAAVVLVTSVISFPMLLDRDVGLPVAVATSVRFAAMNPGPVAAWGLIVAVSLALGSIPVLLGLIVVLPVLGHATWHLYRRAVV
jgi:uncharacterized membrane protein